MTPWTWHEEREIGLRRILVVGIHDPAGAAPGETPEATGRVPPAHESLHRVRVWLHHG